MRVFGKATNWLVNQIRSTIDIRKIYRFLSLIKNQNMYPGKMTNFFLEGGGGYEAMNSSIEFANRSNHAEGAIIL